MALAFCAAEMGAQRRPAFAIDRTSDDLFLPRARTAWREDRLTLRSAGAISQVCAVGQKQETFASVRRYETIAFEHTIEDDTVHA